MLYLLCDWKCAHLFIPRHLYCGIQYNKIIFFVVKRTKRMRQITYLLRESALLYVSRHMLRQSHDNLLNDTQ